MGSRSVNATTRDRQRLRLPIDRIHHDTAPGPACRRRRDRHRVGFLARSAGDTQHPQIRRRHGTLKIYAQVFQQQLVRCWIPEEPRFGNSHLVDQ